MSLESEFTQALEGMIEAAKASIWDVDSGFSQVSINRNKDTLIANCFSGITRVQIRRSVFRAVFW